MTCFSFKSPIAAAAAAALVLAAGSSHAGTATTTVSGQINFHNDVVLIDVVLNGAASNLAFWTDSWQSGLNFDPIAAFWVASGNDYTLAAEVDDDHTIHPSQGFYDTGLSVASLPAGQYRVSLAASFNGANGTLLSQGFAYDSQTPILLTQWNQPSYDPNNNDQKGGFWRANFSNVDGVSVVPEPGTWALMALGLAGLLAATRRARV